jgi:hypothetical protein
MEREAIHDAWVPTDGAWSRWAKPVLFAQMDILSEAVRWVPSATGKTALLVDLPGAEAVHIGLALAARGYRPVPLFNACTGPGELIDQGPIAQALQAGAECLSALALPASAPPAFLLDSRRKSVPRVLSSGMLDNRWEVFPDDFPSPQALRQRGVSQILLIHRGQRWPQPDVARTLRTWQQDGIELQVKDIGTNAGPRQLVVRPIPWYLRWWYGLQAGSLSEDRRLEGFGYIVRRSSSG